MHPAPTTTTITMAMYMYSDREYDYYGSAMNKPLTHTQVIARDSRGNITFKHEGKGLLTSSAVKKILTAWCVDTEKERVEIQYI